MRPIQGSWIPRQYRQVSRHRGSCRVGGMENHAWKRTQACEGAVTSAEARSLERVTHPPALPPAGPRAAGPGYPVSHFSCRSFCFRMARLRQAAHVPADALTRGLSAAEQGVAAPVAGFTIAPGRKECLAGIHALRCRPPSLQKSTPIAIQAWTTPGCYHRMASGSEGTISGCRLPGPSAGRLRPVYDLSRFPPSKALRHPPILDRAARRPDE